MDWNDIARWIVSKTCRQRRCWGDCEHPNSKAGNPCDKVMQMHDICEHLSQGETADTDALLEWANHQVCHAGRNGGCDHKGCLFAQDVIALLEVTISHEQVSG